MANWVLFVFAVVCSANSTVSYFVIICKLDLFVFAFVCLLLPVQFHTLSSLANWVCLCLLLRVACTVSYLVITGKLGLFVFAVVC